MKSSGRVSEATQSLGFSVDLHLSELDDGVLEAMESSVIYPLVDARAHQGVRIAAGNRRGSFT